MQTISLSDLGNIALTHEDSMFYGNVDGLSLQNIFYTRNKKFPGCYLFTYDQRTNGDYYFDVPQIYNWLMENVAKDEDMELVPYFTKKLGDPADYKKMVLCVILNKSNIYARIEKSPSDSYILFDNSKVNEVKKFIEDLSAFYMPPANETVNYWRIATSQSGYYLEKGRVKCPDNFDVTKLYNDSFIKEDEKIRNFISEDDHSGLVILHGDKGTGKSSYIKYLVTSFPDRKFVYVSSAFIGLLGDPSFGSFLATLNNHVIVLEDCENAIRDRKTSGMAGAVSLLLNMTDGILSDDLGIKFICTFNEDMKNIDPALLRKGRLVSKYEFKPLEIPKAQAILEERGIETTLTKPLSLAELFYFEEDGYDISKKSII